MNSFPISFILTQGVALVLPWWLSTYNQFSWYSVIIVSHLWVKMPSASTPRGNVRPIKVRQLANKSVLMKGIFIVVNLIQKDKWYYAYDGLDNPFKTFGIPKSSVFSIPRILDRIFFNSVAHHRFLMFFYVLVLMFLFLNQFLFFTKCHSFLLFFLKFFIEILMYLVFISFILNLDVTPKFLLVTSSYKL